MTIGARIKKLRGKMTQASLAKVLGITQPTLTAYETQGKTPTLNTLIALAEYFHVSLDYLVRGIEKPEIVNYGAIMAFVASLLDSNLEVRISDEVKRFDILGRHFDFTGSEGRNFGAGDELKNLAQLWIVDDRLADLFRAWAKTYSLYADGTIDKDLYQTWYDKQFQEYSCIALPALRKEDIGNARHD